MRGSIAVERASPQQEPRPLEKSRKEPPICLCLRRKKKGFRAENERWQPYQPDGSRLFWVGFRASGESSYDRWADDHENESKTDKKIMH